MEGQNDKKSKTPSPFEGHDTDRGDDKPEGMPSNGLMQNGIEEEPYRYYSILVILWYIPWQLCSP